MSVHDLLVPFESLQGGQQLALPLNEQKQLARPTPRPSEYRQALARSVNGLKSPPKDKPPSSPASQTRSSNSLPTEAETISVRGVTKEGGHQSAENAPPDRLPISFDVPVASGRFAVVRAEVDENLIPSDDVPTEFLPPEIPVPPSSLFIGAPRTAVVEADPQAIDLEQADALDPESPLVPPAGLFAQKVAEQSDVDPSAGDISDSNGNASNENSNGSSTGSSNDNGKQGARLDSLPTRNGDGAVLTSREQRDSTSPDRTGNDLIDVDGEAGSERPPQRDSINVEQRLPESHEQPTETRDAPPHRSEETADSQGRSTESTALDPTFRNEGRKPSDTPAKPSVDQVATSASVKIDSSDSNQQEPSQTVQASIETTGQALRENGPPTSDGNSSGQGRQARNSDRPQGRSNHVSPANSTMDGEQTSTPETVVAGTGPQTIDDKADVKTSSSQTVDPVPSRGEPQPETGTASTNTAARADTTSDLTATKETVPQGDVDRTELIERLNSAISSSAKNGRQLTMRLHPPELGALQVDVTVRDGAMIVRLEAETVAAQKLILEQISQLREALTHQGSLIERIEVNLADSQDNTSRHEQDSDSDPDGFQQEQQPGSQQQQEEQSHDERSSSEDDRDSLETVSEGPDGRPRSRNEEFTSSVDQIDIQV